MTKLLSDEKIDEIAKDYKAILLGGNPYFPWFDFARAIEAAVLEAQGKQEPVAWMHVNQFGIVTGYSPVGHGENWKPLYAAPVVQPGMAKLREHVAWCMKGSASLVEKAFNEVPGQGEVSLQVALGEKLKWWMRTAELIAAAEGKSNARLTVAEPVGRASDSTRKLDIGD